MFKLDVYTHTLKLHTQGLKMFSAMVIVPTLQIAWTLFSILRWLWFFV